MENVIIDAKSFLEIHPEKWAKALMDNANDAIFVLAMDGEILEANRQAETLLGYRKNQLRGRYYHELLDPEDLGYAMAEVERVLRDGIGPHSEVRLKRLDQEAVWVEFSGILVELEGQKVLLGIGRDTTERRRCDEEMMRLASIVASSGDAICGLNLEGHIVTWNLGAERLYGYGAAEIMGHSAVRLVPARNHSEMKDMIESCLSGLPTKEIETFHLNRAHQELEVSASFSPVLGRSGQVVGVSMIARDITARKRSERELFRDEEQLLQAQKMEILGQLAGGVAHDFNNILGVIGGNAEFLLSGNSVGPSGIEEIEEIQKAVRRGAALTRQLLAFSHKQEAQPQELELKKILLDLRKMLSRLVAENVEIKIVTMPELGPVFADPLQIQKIVMNLVINSCDAMPKGGCVLVEARTWNKSFVLPPGKWKPNQGAYLLLSVIDSGTGMDPKTLERVFEPFFTTKPVGKGTGLGLPTVREAVEQLGGVVWVESELGKGTAVRILLPVLKRTE